MDTLQLPQDFSDFLRLLNENSVEYLLVGGYAVAYHGYPRTTLDMDIWIAMNAENAAKMVNVMRGFGFSGAISPEIFLAADGVVRLGVPPMKLEIMMEASGVEFEECYSNRVIATIDDVIINIISLADLRANKRATGRHKDLNDLEHLPR